MKKSHLKLTGFSAMRGIYLKYVSEKVNLICAKRKMDFSNHSYWHTKFFLWNLVHRKYLNLPGLQFSCICSLNCTFLIQQWCE